MQDQVYFRGLKHARLNKVAANRIRNTFLLTTDHGDWLPVSVKEYTAILQEDFSDPILKQRLLDKGILVTKDNLSSIVDKYRKKQFYQFTGTSLHIIVTTLRCNHRCVYCHSEVKGPDAVSYDMDLKTAKETVDFIFQSPSPTIKIEFQGGEPLLNFAVLKYIVEYATEKNKTHNKKLGFDLVTNLTAMDEQKLQWLIKHNISLCTSFDGPDFVHDKNRIYLVEGQGHAEVSKWIREIHKHNYPLGVLMVATKHSLQYWKEIIDEYVKHDLRWIKLRHVDKLGYADTIWENINYSAEAYLTFWKNGIDYLVYLNKKGVKIGDRYVAYLMKKLNREPVNLTCNQSPCGAVTGQMAYDFNGDIYTCDEGRLFDTFKLGNVSNSSHKQIIASGKSCSMVAASSNVSLLCDSCAFSPYCVTCPVCNYAEEGTLIPKLPLSYRCQVQYGQFAYLFDKLISNPDYREIFEQWRDSVLMHNV